MAETEPALAPRPNALTTFPTAFDDEPEPGLLPTFLSRVKSTFVSSSSVASSSSRTSDKGKDVRPPVIKVEPEGKTEAQAIAEAARTRSHTRQTSVDGLRPPLHHSASSSISSTPSSSSKRLAPPGEWKPSNATTAQVTVSPITSVTTTVQASQNVSPPIQRRPSVSSPRSKAHFGLQAAIAQRAVGPHVRPASAMGHAGVRLRRSSIATLPDSPSSVSLSNMIAANTELSHISNVPGFALGNDDTRSVRSLGFVKKSNSVSRLIRRMRGEGLSKHYWMADEHCKECYDCKSVSVLLAPLTLGLYRMAAQAPLSNLRSDLLQPLCIQHHRCKALWTGRRCTCVQLVPQDHGGVQGRRR